MARKVAIMCGHGTQTNGVWDSGCAYSGYTEAGLMLPITKAAVKYLRSSGFSVITDADFGNNKNIITGVAWANAEKADIFISIHCDYSGAPTGVYPLYTSSKGKTLASALNTSVKSELGMKSRGVAKRTDLYELNYTDMPSCILETGSIKADLSILKNKPDAYGKAIAKGICKYFGVTFKAPAATTTTTATSLEKTVKKMQKWLGLKNPTGYIGGQKKANSKYYPGLAKACRFDGGSGKSTTVKKLQKLLGVKQSGVMGATTIKKFQTYLNKHQSKIKLKVDGEFGPESLKALEAFLATSPSTPKVSTGTTSASNRRAKLIKYLDSYGAVIEHSFRYSNSNSKTTWTSAKKNKITNCARYVSWALQAAGVLGSGKCIYYKNGLKGNGASAIKKSSKVKVTHPNKKWSSCNLVPGDVCMFGQGNHTMVYAGKSKKGYPLWYTAGPGDVAAHNVTRKRRRGYESRKVSCKIHMVK